MNNNLITIKKHIINSIIIGLIVVIIDFLINLIPNTQFQIGWLSVFTITIYRCFRQYYTYVECGQKPFWLNFRAVITLVDIIASVSVFSVILLVFGLI